MYLLISALGQTRLSDISCCAPGFFEVTKCCSGVAAPTSFPALAAFSSEKPSLLAVDVASPDAL